MGGEDGKVKGDSVNLQAFMADSRHGFHSTAVTALLHHMSISQVTKFSKAKLSRMSRKSPIHTRHVLKAKRNDESKKCFAEMTGGPSSRARSYAQLAPCLALD